MGFHFTEPLFDPGRLLVSDEVMESIPDYMRYLRRHQSGDWGNVCEDYAAANQNAMRNGDEILSLYSTTLPDGTVKDLCIMSEKGRIYTVVFLVSQTTSK
jgi:hypothetical protein